MKINTRDMVLIAMFAALTAIGAQLSIPTEPIPFTLQVLFCMYSGLLLGSKKGAFSQILYVLLGLAGLPIFAGGNGGPSIIISPTFGYLLGFIACAYVSGKIIENFKEVNILKIALATVSGLLVVYIVALPYLYLILTKVMNSPTTLNGIVKTGFLAFLGQDLVKCAIVSATSILIIPALRKLGYLEVKKEAVN